MHRTIHVGAPVLMACGSLLAQPVLTRLSPLGAARCGVYGTSADGSIVVGAWTDAAGVVRPFRWTAQGIESISLPAGVRGGFLAVSADGSTCIGPVQSSVINPVYWTSDGVLHELASPAGFIAVTLRAISGDGSVIAGVALHLPGTVPYSRSFRWDRNGGMLDLGSFPTGQAAAAYAVSSDGLVIVGSADVGTRWRGHGTAFRWTEAGGFEDLGDLGRPGSLALGVSPDGSVVVGKAPITACCPTLYQAVRWTAAGIESLGALPGWTSSSCLVLNADGTVIGGHLDADPAMHAAVWTPATGMTDLNASLPALGIDLTGWVLKTVTGISADGRVLIGNGKFHGTDSGWMVRLDGPACYANCDESVVPPVLNVLDFMCFMNRFAAGDARANCDGSSAPPVLNAGDFACFLNAFAAGCS